MNVTAKVTPSEKHAIEWVAGMLKTDVSNLLRKKSVAAILEEHSRLVKLVRVA